MIRVRSSDELMQHTGEGDAYVFKPMNMDTFFKAREMKLRHEEREKLIKEKQAKDLERGLTFNPDRATPEYDEEHNKVVQSLLDTKQDIIQNGDPTGEKRNIYGKLHNEARTIAEQSRNIRQDLQNTHGEIQRNPLINSDEAYKILATVNKNEDGTMKPSTDWKNTAMNDVYSSPKSVNMENLYSTFGKKAGSDMASMRTAWENGDQGSMEMNKQMGKFLVPKVDEKGNMEGYKTDKNGEFVLDINDDTVKSFYGTFPNHESAKQRTESDYAQKLADTGLKPEEYTINEFVGDNLKRYISTSTSRQRDFEDKATVKSDGKSYGDAGGLSSNTQDIMPMNFTSRTKQWGVDGKQLADGEATTQYGAGVDFHPIAIKNKPITIKVANNQTVFDGNSDSPQDAKNLGLQDLIVAGVVHFPVDKKTGAIHYTAPGLNKDWSAEKQKEFIENYVAKNPNLALKPFLTGGTSDASNTFGDETANPSGVSRRDRGTVKKEVKVFYIPYANIGKQLLTYAGAKDSDKFARHIESSQSMRNIVAKRKAYEAEQAKAVQPSTIKPAATKQAAPVGNKVTPKKDPLGLF